MSIRNTSWNFFYIEDFYECQMKYCKVKSRLAACWELVRLNLRCYSTVSSFIKVYSIFLNNNSTSGWRTFSTKKKYRLTQVLCRFILTWRFKFHTHFIFRIFLIEGTEKVSTLKTKFKIDINRILSKTWTHKKRLYLKVNTS